MVRITLPICFALILEFALKNMERLLKTIFWALLWGCLGYFARDYVDFGRFAATFHEPGTISIESLKRSLPPSPITVVFDVDDTTLFSSPGFTWGVKRYGNSIFEKVPTGNSNDQSDSTKKYWEFWSKMNSELDEFSIPKVTGRRLIELHKSRGDRILFVTRRTATEGEKLTEILRTTFNLPTLEPVIFTNQSSKASAFKAAGASITYGDSDRDIKESIEDGIRAIRVKRAPTSTNYDPVHNGAFGEEVLEGSEF